MTARLPSRLPVPLLAARGPGPRRAARRTVRSERPVSAAISLSDSPWSRNSSTRRANGSSRDRIDCNSSARIAASSGDGSRAERPRRRRRTSTASAPSRRAAFGPVVPHLPIKFVQRDRDQQPPQIVLFVKSQAAVAHAEEKAAKRRLHDVLGIGPPRDFRREPTGRQAREPADVAFIERGRRPLIAGAVIGQKFRRGLARHRDSALAPKWLRHSVYVVSPTSA